MRSGERRVRLLSFERNGRVVAGVRLGSEAVDLSLAAPDLPPDILGILAAIVIPQFTSASSDARNNSVSSTLQTIREDF